VNNHSSILHQNILIETIKMTTDTNIIHLMSKWIFKRAN